MIRIAEINDLKDIQKLNVMLLEKEYKEYNYKTLDVSWPRETDGVEYLTKKITDPNSCVFVAEMEGQVVGYVYGGITSLDYPRAKLKTAELESIFILEEHRDRKIGSQLYEEFQKWCKEKKVDIIRLEVSTENKDAIRFYEQNGHKSYTTKLEKEI